MLSATPEDQPGRAEGIEASDALRCCPNWLTLGRRFWRVRQGFDMADTIDPFQTRNETIGVIVATRTGYALVAVMAANEVHGTPYRPNFANNRRSRSEMWSE